MYSLRRFLTALLLVCPALNVAALAADCAPVPDTVADRLAHYVHDSFGFSRLTVIKLADTQLVGADCYRKATFVRLEGGKPYAKINLYLSPNQQFLSHDLMDTTLTVAEYKTTTQRILEKDLTDGVFPTIGSNQADITLTIFSDFQCPYCRQEAAILREWLRTNKTRIRVLFRNLPLTGHRWARAAAEIAACVHAQDNDAFWKLHDALFSHQDEITSETLSSTVDRILTGTPGIDLEDLHKCAADHLTASLVDRDVDFAMSHGIEATPTIFIDGYRHDGVILAEEMETLIREVISRENGAQVKH